MDDVGITYRAPGSGWLQVGVKVQASVSGVWAWVGYVTWIGFEGVEIEERSGSRLLLPWTAGPVFVEDRGSLPPINRGADW